MYIQNFTDERIHETIIIDGNIKKKSLNKIYQRIRHINNYYDNVSGIRMIQLLLKH